MRNKQDDQLSTADIRGIALEQIADDRHILDQRYTTVADAAIFTDQPAKCDCEAIPGCNDTMNFPSLDGWRINTG